MYLDGSFAILLLPLGFAEVQLAVLESEVVNCFDDDLRTGIRFWLFSCAAGYSCIAAACSCCEPGSKFNHEDMHVRKEQNTMLVTTH